LHGMYDNDVPSYLSIELGEQLTTDNMCVNLIAQGDHRMVSDECLEILCKTLGDVIENKGKDWE
jgi:hypothetical protein